MLNIEKIVDYATKSIKSDIETHLANAMAGLSQNKQRLYTTSIQDAKMKIEEAKEMGFEVNNYSKQVKSLEETYQK